MSTKPKKFCFVLMPFESDFDDIYQLGIKQSCIDAGAYCERVDEQIFHESILERIYNQISKADIIIADMTNKNPNVFYEVGYAHALGKTTILLTKKAEDIPFDLKQYPHIIYNSSISKLKEELTTRVKWCVENENNDRIEQKIGIDVYLDDKSLSNKDVYFFINKNFFVTYLTLTLYNNTFTTFNPIGYRIGIITNRENYLGHMRKDKTIKMPDGRYLHMLSVLQDILYPNSYTSFEITFREDEKIQPYEEITIRIFTSNGTRDFFLQIKYEE